MARVIEAFTANQMIFASHLEHAELTPLAKYVRGLTAEKWGALKEDLDATLKERQTKLDDCTLELAAILGSYLPDLGVAGCAYSVTSLASAWENAILEHLSSDDIEVARSELPKTLGRSATFPCVVERLEEIVQEK